MRCRLPPSSSGAEMLVRYRATNGVVLYRASTRTSAVHCSAAVICINATLHHENLLQQTMTRQAVIALPHFVVLAHHTNHWQ